MECSIERCWTIGTSYEYETIVKRIFEETTELYNGKVGRSMESEQK